MLQQANAVSILECEAVHLSTNTAIERLRKGLAIYIRTFQGGEGFCRKVIILRIFRGAKHDDLWLFTRALDMIVVERQDGVLRQIGWTVDVG